MLKVFLVCHDEVSLVERARGARGPLKRTVLGHVKGCHAMQAFDDNTFYYIRSSPHMSLCRWSLPSSETDVLCDVGGSPCALMVHRNRVYVADGGSRLLCYDPLSGAMESFNLLQEVVDIVPADHGFVFLDPNGDLHSFQFNLGVTRVSNLDDRPQQLLGSRRGWALVLLRGGTIIEVNEVGETRPLSSGDCIGSKRFAFSSDSVVHADLDTLHVDGVPTEVTPTLEAPISFLFSASVAEVNDACAVCLCDFDDGDGVTLDCGHRFHVDCVRECASHSEAYVAKGEHIVFNMAMCPGGCGSLCRHAAAPRSRIISDRYQLIQSDAKKRLQQLPAETVDGLLYYLCHHCEKPFFGGLKSCPRMTPSEPLKRPDELVCLTCMRDFVCPSHSRDFVAYKCRYCCNVATNLSFGNRWTCDACLALWVKEEPGYRPCLGKEQCPLGGHHPQERSYPIGCFLCLPEARLRWDLLRGLYDTDLAARTG